MLIRESILELLADGDLTAASIADELGALRNSVDKALIRAREEREIHICGYEPTTPRPAAIYRIGDAPYVEVARPAPVAPADERHHTNNARDAKVRGVEMPVYFELDGGLLPGVQHFACSRLRAPTMSVTSCSARWQKANSADVDADRMSTCKQCATGAGHAGRADYNPSKLKGMTICGRCHTGATRLIGKHLCISCKNREYEYLKGRNAKGTKPVKLAPLDRRSITYRTGGAVKTRTIEHTADMTELVIAVLRDELSSVAFGYRAPAAMDWLLDGGVYDRSIGDAVEVADVAAIVDSVQEAPKQGSAPIVASPVEYAAVPVPAALDVVQEDPVADVEVDSLQVLRDAVEQLEHDVPASMPATSRRADKRQRRQQWRQLRVSNVTVGILRTVGALPPPAPVVVPAPTPFYTAALFVD
jgi:hypothetical protein